MKEFGVSTILIRNTINYQKLNPSDIDPENIKLVHHGGALPGRKLELMINMIEFLDKRFRLHFYMVVPSQHINYFKSLKIRTEKYGGTSPEIATYVNKYHIGVVSDDFLSASFAKALNKLTTDDIQKLKNNSHQLADVLSLKKEKVIINK